MLEESIDHSPRRLGRRLLAPMAGVAVAMAIAPGAIAAAASEQEARVPVIYPVPMRGQMGTDIHPSIYERVAEDIRRVRPDLVVFMLDSADFDEVFYLNNNDRDEFGQARLSDYRNIVITLRDGLREFDQVMWVEDSVGFSALMALSWPTMYMKPRSRLWGLQRVSDMARGWADPDVAAKMMSAWTGIGKGFLERGGHPLELGEAMMKPELTLSASFEGRRVTWSLDTNGHWVVDSSPNSTTNLRAELAEDLGIAAGIAETLDDIAFLTGWREFEVNTSGQEMVEKYVTDWRRAFERTIEWVRDAEQSMQWAQGEDAVRYLGRAQQNYQRIIAAMRQYPAVENRWQQQFRVSQMQLEVWVEQFRERLRGLRGGRGGAGGGGGGGGGGGRGGSSPMR
jgi:hypothetical protein